MRKIIRVIPAKALKGVAGIQVLFFLFLGISEALACPVCFSGKGATLHAYQLSTLFLTLFPLILIFGSFYWVYRQLKKKGDL